MNSTVGPILFFYFFLNKVVVGPMNSARCPLKLKRVKKKKTQNVKRAKCESKHIRKIENVSFYAKVDKIFCTSIVMRILLHALYITGGYSSNK